MTEIQIDNDEKTVTYDFHTISEASEKFGSSSIQLLGIKSFFLIANKELFGNKPCVITFIIKRWESSKEQICFASSHMKYIVKGEKIVFIMEYFVEANKFKYRGWIYTKDIYVGKPLFVNTSLPDLEPQVPVEPKFEVFEVKKPKIDVIEASKITRNKLPLIYDRTPNFLELPTHMCSTLMQLRRDLLVGMEYEIIGEEHYYIEFAELRNSDDVTIRSFQQAFEKLRQYTEDLYKLAIELSKESMEEDCYATRLEKMVIELDNASFWLFNIMFFTKDNLSSLTHGDLFEYQKKYYSREKTLLLTKIHSISPPPPPPQKKKKSKLMSLADIQSMEIEDNTRSKTVAEVVSNAFLDSHPNAIKNAYGDNCTIATEGEISELSDCDKGMILCQPKPVFKMFFPFAVRLFPSRKYVLKKGMVYIGIFDLIINCLHKQIYLSILHDKERRSETCQLIQSDPSGSLKETKLFSNTLIDSKPKYSVDNKINEMPIVDIEDCVGPKAPMCIWMLNQKMEKSFSHRLNNEERVFLSSYLLDTKHTPEQIYQHTLKKVGPQPFKEHFKSYASRPAGYLASKGRKYYTCSCAKYFEAKCNSDGQPGCPYVYLSEDELEKFLKQKGTSKESIEAIIQAKTSKVYQKCCEIEGGFQTHSTRVKSPITYFMKSFGSTTN